jgi:hypothetical protein
MQRGGWEGRAKNRLGVLEEEKGKLEAQREALNDEKKRYMLFNLLKDDVVNKDKLERINKICDE